MGRPASILCPFHRTYTIHHPAFHRLKGAPLLSLLPVSGTTRRDKTVFHIGPNEADFERDEELQSSSIDPGGTKGAVTPSAWPSRGENTHTKENGKEGKRCSRLMAWADRPEERACLRHLDEPVEISSYCPVDRRDR